MIKPNRAKGRERVVMLGVIRRIDITAEGSDGADIFVGLSTMVCREILKLKRSSRYIVVVTSVIEEGT